MNIRVNGKDYPWPQVETLTLDEAITLQRVSGKALPEVERSLTEGDLASIKGLMHIAVMRAEATATFKEIETALGELPIVDLEKVFADMLTTDSAPLDTTVTTAPSVPESQTHSGDTGKPALAQAQAA